MSFSALLRELLFGAEINSNNCNRLNSALCTLKWNTHLCRTRDCTSFTIKWEFSDHNAKRLDGHKRKNSIEDDFDALIRLKSATHPTADFAFNAKQFPFSTISVNDYATCGPCEWSDCIVPISLAWQQNKLLEGLMNCWIPDRSIEGRNFHAASAFRAFATIEQITI